MKIALPIGLMMLVASFIILTKIIYPSTFEINVATKSKINQALEKLGGISRDEKKSFYYLFNCGKLMDKQALLEVP